VNATAVVLLALTAALLAAAGFLFVRSLRRNDALDACTGMCTVMAAGVPAVVYGALAV
jgi:hypothetical protein